MRMRRSMLLATVRYWPLVVMMASLLAVSCDTCDTSCDGEPDIPETVSLSISMASWVPASPPSGFAWEDTRRMWWYLRDREVHEEDLYPGAESKPGESFIPILEMGIWNFMYPEPDDEKQWAGIQHLLSAAGANLSGFDFIEIWLRQTKGYGGVLSIDAGDVSENFYHPWAADSLHTEDKDGDGELSQVENTGYDGLADGLPGDDPHDHYYYSESAPDSIKYVYVNGTENDPNQYVDTEDLDNDGALDTDEVHFRFSIDLSDTSYRVFTNGDWVLYRIPLSEAEAMHGRPSWTSIRYVRMYFTGIERLDRFQTAGILFGDSSWAEWLEPLLRPGGN